MSKKLKEKYTDTIFEDMHKISSVSDLLSLKDAHDWRFNYIEKALKLVPGILKYIIERDTIYLSVGKATEKYGITFRLGAKEEILTELCIAYHDEDILLYPITRDPTLMEVKSLDDLDIRHMLIARAKKVYPSICPKNLTFIVNQVENTLLCRVNGGRYFYETIIKLD